MRGYQSTNISATLRNMHHPVEEAERSTDGLVDTLPSPASCEGTVDFSACPLADPVRLRRAKRALSSSEKLRTMRYR